MSLFSFIRGKTSPKSRGENWRDKPEVRSVTCAARSEVVLKQVENLQAVRRGQDADARIAEYTAMAFEQWKADPQHPSYLITAMIQVISKHSDKVIAVGVHETLLKTLNEMEHTIDLTSLYFSYGCIFQQMGLGEKQLWAYHMAAEAKPPQGCENPAPPRLKAVAHFQARESARKLNDEEKYQWHCKKLMSLVPGIDLNDVEKLWEFVYGKKIDLSALNSREHL